MADHSPSPLRRELGLSAVSAVVVGDMLGSGIFFTPGELAPLAHASWHVYLIWGLCGFITLCGALTLAELGSLLPRAGSIFHAIREAFGPFWAFLRVWMEMWVSGPGSVAGVAFVFGEFLARLAPAVGWSSAAWGAAAIGFFTGVNLLGVRWGGRTQVTLTSLKVLGLIGLVGGSLLFAQAVPAAPPTAAATGAEGLWSFVRLAGLGVAAVLFTYDGWLDVSHVAGEVKAPQRTLPLGLGLGVGGITVLYLVVNHAYLRVVPLDVMREAPSTIATTVAMASFGEVGGRLLNVLIVLSIFGALGGLVMTLPRLFYAAAVEHGNRAGGGLGYFFAGLAVVSRRSAVPVGSILFTSALSIVALLYFGSFERLVNFFVVPLHLANILLVLAVFRLRPRAGQATPSFRTPGYPWTPLVYVTVIGLFLATALVYRPLDTLIGVALAATGVPAYLWQRRSVAR